jgi:general secretion pathway protein L
MSVSNGLIVFLPSDGDDTLPWWHWEDGAIIARGYADLQADDTIFPSGFSGLQVMAIAPTAKAVVRWIDMGDMPPKQAETAARLKVAGESLGLAEHVHVVSAFQESSGEMSSSVMTASISSQQLQYGLDQLAKYGFDPDVVIPAGLILPASGDTFVSAQIGNDRVLRGPRIILPDEPELRAAYAIGDDITVLDNAAADDALLYAATNPALNLRNGVFSKRSKGGPITVRQWKILATLVAAGLCFSFLLAAATYWQYDRGVARENAAALNAVRKIAPSAVDIESAQAVLDKALAKRGAGQGLTGPMAALYSILKRNEGVTVRDLRYSQDGILTTTLAAPTIDPINATLVSLQQQGYKITATPRQDASGLAMADISMRSM